MKKWFDYQWNPVLFLFWSYGYQIKRMTTGVYHPPKANKS